MKTQRYDIEYGSIIKTVNGYWIPHHKADALIQKIRHEVRKHMDYSADYHNVGSSEKALEHQHIYKGLQLAIEILEGK